MPIPTLPYLLRSWPNGLVFNLDTKRRYLAMIGMVF